MAPIRKGIQLAMPFEERRLLNQGRFSVRWTPPYLVQPKLNGERCRLLREGEACLLLSSTEELILSVPHIQQWGLKHLPQGEFDGELYVHGWTWSEIHSVVGRTTNLHPDYAAMELHLFDWPSRNEPQLMRSVELRRLIEPMVGPIKLTPSHVCSTLEEVYQLYDRFIGEGYEGFIVRELSAYYERKRSGAMMKFKPKATDHYEIVGVYEAISEDGIPKGMVGGFNCIDDMRTLFSVGAGKLSHNKRIQIWQQWLDTPQYIIGSLLEVEYQTMSDKNKVPLFSRAVRII
jgi:ATP-dependent DNA ligase